MKLRRKKRRQEDRKLRDSKRIKLLEEKQNEIKNETNSSSILDLGSIDSPLFRSKNPFRRNSLENVGRITSDNKNTIKLTRQKLLDALDHDEAFNNDVSIYNIFFSFWIKTIKS